MASICSESSSLCRARLSLYTYRPIISSCACES